VVANLHEFAISFQITVNYLQIGVQKEKKKTLGFTFQVNRGQYYTLTCTNANSNRLYLYNLEKEKITV
jgi:hypothetical protein